MTTHATDLPNYKRAELVAVEPTLTLMADLLAGPEHLWDKSRTYIRKWTDEDEKVYDIRRKSEPAFGGLKRTLAAASGMLFAKPPAIEWGAHEAQWSALWDNIDHADTKGDVFTKRCADVGIRDGLALLLVDYAKRPTEAVVVTAANEEALGLRPVWSLYQRAQALNWHAAPVNGRIVLHRVTLMESTTEPLGLFGVRVRARYRDLRLVDGVATWKLWEESASVAGAAPQIVPVAGPEGEGVFTNRRGEPARELPLAIAYVGVTDAPLTASVPLKDVAYANLGHWRYATNLTFAREVSGFEQLVVTGSIAPNPVTQQPGKLQIGPLVGIHMETGGDVKWIGPSGSGLAELALGCKEKMEQMDQMGLGFLVPHKNVQTTATEARLDSYAQLSTLATAGIAIADAINRAWELTAWYEGLEPSDAPVVTINTDFEASMMDSATMTAYVALVTAGFPKRQVLEALQAGGRIHEDADLDTLELEWESGVIADREAKAVEAEANAARMASMTGGKVPPQPEDDDDA